MQWSDGDFEVTDDDDEHEHDTHGNGLRLGPLGPSFTSLVEGMSRIAPELSRQGSLTPKGTSAAEISDFLTTTPQSGTSGNEAATRQSTNGSTAHGRSRSSTTVAEDATHVGLRRSLDHAGDEGIAAQVAHLAFPSTSHSG